MRHLLLGDLMSNPVVKLMSVSTWEGCLTCAPLSPPGHSDICLVYTDLLGPFISKRL